jgi:DNA polymerase-3 subunit alpha
MGKKIASEMAAQSERFLEGCARNSHPRAESEKIFEQMVVFAGYAFPKAHSAAYALITHQTAYLKAHYAAEFYAATMSAEWREPDKLDRYMKDAARRGIAIKAPDVNESDAEFTVTEGGRAVRFGLEGIKNVGEGAVEALLDARRSGGPFRSLFDLCERVDAQKINRRVLESLIRCGGFDFTGATRAALADALALAMERGQRTQRDRAVGQQSLFAALPEAVAEPRMKELPEWPKAELLAGEKETLGFFVTGHPLDDHRCVLQAFASLRIDQITEEWRGREVRLGGLITGLTTQKTRRGDLMARAQFEDGHGALSAVFFPKVFEQHAALLRSGEPLFVRGALQVESERSELLAEEVIALDEAWNRYASELVIRLPAQAVSRERLRELRRLLDPTPPGRTAVAVEVVLPSGAEAELRLCRHKVRASDALLRSVDQLFGAEVVRCRA